jgi:hypothetical protein
MKDPIRTVLANLGPRRHPFMRAAAEFRDRCVAAGEHRQAAVWHELSVAIAEIVDTERDILAALAPPGVAVIEPPPPEGDPSP